MTTFVSDDDPEVVLGECYSGQVTEEQLTCDSNFPDRCSSLAGDSWTPGVRELPPDVDEVVKNATDVAESVAVAAEIDGNGADEVEVVEVDMHQNNIERTTTPYRVGDNTWKVTLLGLVLRSAQSM